jgi:RimJ/RimL family protein N-acetyltransferase
VVHDVRKARRDEAAGLSRALALAFHADPAFSWLVPDDARRRAVLGPNFQLLLRRTWLRHEETYTQGEVTGACIWNPPGAWKVGLREELSLLPALGRVWGRHSLRGLRALAALERRHPAEEHFYLVFMGVEPANQGRGIGSAMMFPVLSRCDSDRIPAYLEASSPRSRALYERHGFEVTEEFELGAGSPPLWRMWREPV